MPLPPAPCRAATRQRRKDARPQELLDAALQLFIEKGFAATRSEEVAARAGVSKGTLYLYFPSKEELFKAVVRTNLSSLIAEGQQIADADEGPTSELLRRLMQTWWQRVGFTAAGGISKIIVAEVRNFPDLAQFYVDEVVLPAAQVARWHTATRHRPRRVPPRAPDRRGARPDRPFPLPRDAQTLHRGLSGPRRDADERRFGDRHPDRSRAQGARSPCAGPRAGQPEAPGSLRMKRWTKGLLIAVAVGVLGLAIGRVLLERRSAASASAEAPKAPAALDLAPSDVVTRRATRELVRTTRASPAACAPSTAPSSRHASLPRCVRSRCAKAIASSPASC